MAELRALTRPEFIADIPFVANSEQTLPTRGGVLPSDFNYWGLLLEVEGRFTKGVNPLLSVNVGGLNNLIQEVRIEGLHRIRKQTEEFFRLRGTHIAELAQRYSNQWLQTPSEFYGANVDAVGNTDFRFFLPITFPPERLPLVQQAAYLLDAPNYDNLTLTVRFGDGPCVGPPGAGTTFAFTAYNSAVGAPRVRVHGIFSSFGGSGTPGFVPARVWRYYQENVNDLLVVQNAARLININRGNVIRSLYLRQGTLAAGLTAGNIALGAAPYVVASADTFTNNIRVMRGTNKQIRSFADYQSIRNFVNYVYGYSYDVGFDWQPGTGALIDFAEQSDVFTALDTTQLIAGPTGDVDLFLQADVPTAAAGRRFEMITQEIRGIPVGLRSGR